MPFPEFNPDKKKILFFSRGRGRGHAVPDMEIVKELQKIRHDVEVRFVSYSTGARTIEEAGFPLIDVDLPVLGEDARMTALSGRLINWLKPDLVVSHEEFLVLPVAKIFDRPTIVILDWFVEPQRLSMRTLMFADQILFIEEPSLFEEPPWVDGKVEYVGRFVREFTYGPEDRERARRELGLPQEALVVSVFPGTFATEERAPMVDLLVPAFTQLPHRLKVLVWVAGQDRDLIQSKLAGRSDALVLQNASPPERLMVASDVGVTKGNRGSVIDLLSLAIPAVVVTYAHRPMDDKIVAGLDGAVQLRAGKAEPSALAQAIAEQLTKKLRPHVSPGKVASICASRISQKLGAG